MVTTCSPRPMRAVQRARLWAITWMASQAPLAAKREGPAGSAFLGHPGESPRGRIHIMTLMRTTAGINKMEAAGAGARTNQIHRCFAAGFADEADQLSRISWPDLPGDLVRPKFGNI